MPRTIAWWRRRETEGECCEHGRLLTEECWEGDCARHPDGSDSSSAGEYRARRSRWERNVTQWIDEWIRNWPEEDK